MKIEIINKIIKKIIVISMIILFFMGYTNILNGCVYAIENPADGAKSQKSSNANLDNLGIKPYDFYGFEEDILEYTVAVPEKTKEVKIYAEVQNKNAEVTGTGDAELVIGKNANEVVVTAEDGTTKTYTINIIRDDDEYSYQKKLGNSGVFKNIGKGLESLEIEGLQLDKEFDTNVYEYTCKLDDVNITNLEVNGVGTDSEYKVEVIGNTDLKEGKNTVTILVSDDEENIATYQVVVEKPLRQMSIVDSAGNIFENISMEYIYAFWIIIGIILLLIVVRKIYKKIKRNSNKNRNSELIEKMKKYNSKYDDEREFDYENDDSDEEFEHDIELPKGLKNNSKSSEKKKKEVAKVETGKGKRYKM